jgi:hypothetical protein
MNSAGLLIEEKIEIESDYLEGETLSFCSIDPSQKLKILFPSFTAAASSGGAGFIQFVISGASAPSFGELGTNFQVRIPNGSLRGTYSVVSVEEEPGLSATIVVSGTYPFVSTETVQIYLLSETTVEIYGGYRYGHPANVFQPWRKLGEVNVPLFDYIFEIKIAKFLRSYLSAVWDFQKYSFFSPTEDEESSKVVPLFDAVLPVQIKISSWDFDSGDLVENTFPDPAEVGAYNAVFYFWLATLQTYARKDVGAASGLPTAYETDLPFTPILNPLFDVSNSLEGIPFTPGKFIYSRICGYFPALILVAEPGIELNDLFDYSPFIPTTTP